MKTDTYTKIILTIIAVNLTVLTFMQINIIPKVQALNTHEDPLLKNQRMEYGLIPVNEDGSITVRLADSDELDVNITGIETNDKMNVGITEIDTWDNMNINIKEIDTRDIMNVKVKEVDRFAFTFSTVPVKVKK